MLQLKVHLLFCCEIFEAPLFKKLKFVNTRINNVFVFLQEKVCMVCAWKVNFLSFILTRNSSLIPSISVTLWRVQLKSRQKIIPTWWGNKWGGWVELFAVFTDKKSFQRWHMALNPACHWRIPELRFLKIAQTYCSFDRPMMECWGTY